MSTTFPTSLQDLDATRGTTGQPLSTPNHITHHTTEDDTIEALQAKVGINGSAVTTTHDYKLSGVTGSDKAVSKTGTETLTNKTLTTPAITTPTFTLGSDATGDIWYRHSDGTMKRLGIGSANQVLNVTGGVPAWRDETAVINANTTTKGVVEMATAAEITAGTATGGTGAALAMSPDQFALSTPVFNGSGLTALPAIAALREDAPNTAITFGNYFTSVITVDGDVGWTFGGTPTRMGNGVSLAGTVNTACWASIVGKANSYSATVNFDSGIDVKMAYWFTPSHVSVGTSPAAGTDHWYFHGFCNPDVNVIAASNITVSSTSCVGFVHYNGRIYTSTVKAGTGITTNDIMADPGQVKKAFMIDYTPSSVKFYINGSLVATHTTNIPSTLADGMGMQFGSYRFDGTASGFAVSQITLSETLS